MLKLKIHFTGIREVLRALSALPKDAQNEMRDQVREVSDKLARRIRSAGEADSPQSAVAAKSVRSVRGRLPEVEAGRTGGRKVRAVLFGSEFGMTRHTGWYNRGRYFFSRGTQFRPHQGSHSYWFFSTAEAETPWMETQWRAIADKTVEKWSA